MSSCKVMCLPAGRLRAFAATHYAAFAALSARCGAVEQENAAKRSLPKANVRLFGRLRSLKVPLYYILSF